MGPENNAHDVARTAYMTRETPRASQYPISHRGSIAATTQARAARPDPGELPALPPDMRVQRREKLARYLRSVARRAEGPEELSSLLAEAVEVAPGVRFKSSYLRLRWRALLGRPGG